VLQKAALYEKISNLKKTYKLITKLHNLNHMCNCSCSSPEGMCGWRYRSIHS